MGVPVLILLLFRTLLASDSASIAAARAKAQDPAAPFSVRSAAYLQLIRSNASDASLYADYASLLIANRDFENARVWIAKGLTIAPSSSPLQLRNAIALHASSQYDASLKILKALPASAESKLYLGLNCRAMGDHQCARQNLEEARGLGLRDAYALYCLIEEDHALGDKPSGLRHFRSFLEEFPDSPWLHVLYANAYTQKDADAEARKEYREALRLQPDLAAVNFRLGFLLFKDGEYSAAVDSFRKELALNPAYSDANLFLGQSLRNLGKDAEAIVHLRKAIALDARSELAYKALAAALTDQGDLAGAVQSLRAAEKEFPADPSFPAQLASLLTKLNREDEALQELAKFRALKQQQKPVGQPQQ